MRRLDNARAPNICRDLLSFLDQHLGLLKASSDEGQSGQVQAAARDAHSIPQFAEDGVRLILHELSVGLLRGRRRPPGPREFGTDEILAQKDQVAYVFEGEFWTDELDDLVVNIPDRCLEEDNPFSK